MMDSRELDQLTTKYPISERRGPIAKGKTKLIYPVTNNPRVGIFIHKDDITAGDGTKHDILAGKGRLANATTCNVFDLLKLCGIPLAYIERAGVNCFAAELCSMLPYEVVIRREAHGSFVKRHPEIRKGTVFPNLVVEFYLKTTLRQWKEYTLPCDDPLMEREHDVIYLYVPSKPLGPQRPFLRLPEREIFSQTGEGELFPEMRRVASLAFLILEKAWALEGGRLVDYKVEFGLNPEGKLVLADVIDNDSWRVVEKDTYLDKQVYRDGGDLAEVLQKYQRVAQLTERFPEHYIEICRSMDL
jgi:phosphoribosylaminoimidazole-succinocarboxamide synthase